MPENILDLDILNPESISVKLKDKVIDVSFIPVGIVFEVDDIVKELAALETDEEELKQNVEKQRKSIDVAIRLCSAFCRVKNPEMDEQWFKEGVSAVQIMKLSKVLRDTLINSYEGVDAGNQ